MNWLTNLFRRKDTSYEFICARSNAIEAIRNKDFDRAIHYYNVAREYAHSKYEKLELSSLHHELYKIETKDVWW